MKKMKRLLVMLAVALFAFTTIVPANAATKKVIGKTKVRSIVEKNTTALKGKKLTIELDRDDGVRYYEVEGKTSARKYEFEIDAYSGKILAREWKLRKLTKGKKKLTKSQARKVIDEKVIARKHQKNYRVEKEYEKGILCYEAEFKTKTRKFEVIVNATTGTVYKMEWDLLKKKN